MWRKWRRRRGCKGERRQDRRWKGRKKGWPVKHKIAKKGRRG